MSWGPPGDIMEWAFVQGQMFHKTERLQQTNKQTNRRDIVRPMCFELIRFNPQESVGLLWQKLPS